MSVSVPLTATYDVADLRQKEFPVSAKVAYLNHAGTSPLPRRSHEAMSRLSEGLMLDPTETFPALMEKMHELQESLRTLINAPSAEDIALVQSTSLAINLAAGSLPWERGQNLIFYASEFPSNAYPWMHFAQQHGVEVRLVGAGTPGLTLDMVERAADSKTRLVAASAVQFFSGHRTDLQAIGDFCHQRGILFSVDAIQSVAHSPIDVQKMHIDICASGGQKSLMGPMGLGFLYVRRELCEHMSPVFVSDNSTVDWMHWLKYDLTPLPGAGRFGTGTFNAIGVAGLLESVKLLQGLGIPAIDTYTTALISDAKKKLEADGYEVVTPADHGPIVTFRAAPDDAGTTQIINALQKQHVHVVKHWDAPKTAHIRASVHCYNTVEDIDRLIEALREVKKS